MMNKCNQCKAHQKDNQNSLNGYKRSCPTCGGDIFFSSHQVYMDWLKGCLKKQKIKFGVISILVITGMIIITIGLSWLIEGIAH